MNNEVLRKSEDLVVGTTNYDPEGNLIYIPRLGKMALWGGVTGAVLLGIMAYLVASGIIPIRDVGQFSTSGNGVATFVGAVTGFAVGGLTGALMGLHHLVKENNKQSKVDKSNQKKMHHV
jgi:hypothetical protein